MMYDYLCEPSIKDQIMWAEQTLGHRVINEKYWYRFVNSGHSSIQPSTIRNYNVEYLVHVLITIDIHQWKYSYRIVCTGCDNIWNGKKKETNGRMYAKQKEETRADKLTLQEETIFTEDVYMSKTINSYHVIFV